MYIFGFHIDEHVILYPYVAMCEASESCEFNSWLWGDLNKRSTKRPAFYTRQEYVIHGTKILVALERLLSDYLLRYLIGVPQIHVSC